MKILIILFILMLRMVRKNSRKKNIGSLPHKDKVKIYILRDPVTGLSSLIGRLERGRRNSVKTRAILLLMIKQKSCKCQEQKM